MEIRLHSAPESPELEQKTGSWRLQKHGEDTPAAGGDYPKTSPETKNKENNLERPIHPDPQSIRIGSLLVV